MELPTTDCSLSYYLTSDNLTSLPMRFLLSYYLTSYYLTILLLTILLSYELTDALVVGHAVERPVDRGDAAEPQVLQPQQQ